MNRTSQRHTLLYSLLAAVFVLLTGPAAIGQDTRPLSEQAYLGLSVREFPDEPGCIVSWTANRCRSFRTALTDIPDTDAPAEAL